MQFSKTDESSREQGRRWGRRRFLKQAAAAAVPAVVLATATPPAFGQAARLSVKANFQDIQQHENDHVAAIVQVLGANARPEPTFQNLLFNNVQLFVLQAQAFENTGSGAYRGAAPAIFSSQVLAAATSIALIEGRHAGWLNTFVGTHITTNVFGQAPSFEQPLTIDQVVTLVTPFIANLNGGPPLTFDPNNPSAANDIKILNFALALEYLERDFYNLNVPRL